MRLPRMSTRRWMVAVALISIGLGGYLEGRRLKRRHDEYLTRAGWHTALAESLRRPRWLSARLARYDHPESDSPEPLEQCTLDSETEPARSDVDERFEQARARAVATADFRRRFVIDSYRKRAEYDQRQAEYHAALGRKYAAAASQPWLPVGPDPPNFQFEASRVW